jgi:hypothetical protein
MRKPLTAALLLGGHLLLTFSPVAALAAPASPASSGESHYRCMYRCDERGDGDRYDHYRDGRYDHRDHVDHDGQCWYHDDWGWHRCGYRHRW